MRALERTRVSVEIARRIRTVGALGSREERFSPVHVRVRASLISQGGETEQTPRGALYRREIGLILPLDACVSTGDAVIWEDMRYEVRALSRWSAHQEIRAVAVT